MTDEPWTVLRLLQWTTEFFQKRGSDSPRLDAEVLLAHARQCSRIELYTAFEEQPDAEQRAAFRELVRRRGEGTPVAQLVGYKEFYSLRFRVDENTLIPRPETEHVVIEAIDCAKAMAVTDRPLQVADVGTGSGAIAIALAVHLPEAEVTAIDLSEAALEIARWNASQHAVQDRIRFVHGDLLADVSQPALFDLICSNPPYVSEQEYEQLDRSVRDHEPRSALVAGEDGTEVIKRLMAESYPRLNPGGRLIIELSPMIAGACEELADQISELGDLRFVKDLAGHRRVLSLRRI
ncbi:peptide chain release factor N(5)-glutamine methyltransferase [Roseiconus nitratireducens]|uniref:Release factor glutamine methyltransferase n=1 Tax=Roseiconus nitratireducens TaxID=2605748 RepID=A0A5M6DDB6_9BACT|nr:peptide chain release factor N(5)-glutamine methyltransferase [Roseiconus nitratireducens]KAA5544400.1 peptide chain release factor N(5)-glutamine methyltransferase [Roseiconus nitratireducens]